LAFQHLFFESSKPMRRELVTTSAVIVAQHFNPSVASQIWLVDQGLVSKEEFEPGCLFTDNVVQVCSRRFNLLVMADQVQLVPRVSESDQGQLIAKTLNLLVKTLPHTPFRALGLNFVWHLVPDDGNVQALTRRLFYVENRPLYREFDVKDAHYGAYLSKDQFGFRLRLDAKPLTVNQQVTAPEIRLQVLFNYHAELPQGKEAVDVIEELLTHWGDAKEESRRITETISDVGGT
jgi:hypothetical protein